MLCRLSAKHSKPLHLASIGMSGADCQDGTLACDGIQQEPIKLTAMGRVRSGGVLNGSVPGSAAAAAVVNMYTGPSGKD